MQHPAEKAPDAERYSPDEVVERDLRRWRWQWQWVHIPDPSLPSCDLDGQIAGAPGTAIAVASAPRDPRSTAARVSPRAPLRPCAHALLYASARHPASTGPQRPGRSSRTILTMLRWTSFLVLIAACGFPRPADVLDPKSCAAGVCTDPAYPFCDEGGEVSGAAKTCIAVSCHPGDFAACRGDNELSCNAAGTTYDVVQCERGCDPAIGCRLCEPNQTVCANGRFQACDAAGAITSSEACPLGCFADQPRCREIDPSNNLGMYLDMVPNPPDLDLTDARFNTMTGEVRNGVSGPPIPVPNFLVLVSGADGISIRVFIANNVRLEGSSGLEDIGRLLLTGPSLAIVARGDITILGSLTADGRAGGSVLPSCVGGNGGQIGIPDDQGNLVGKASAGGGGGGHATDGAEGGALIGASSFGSGSKGMAAGNNSLVPLRGGCPGGLAPGGGAIQLSSRTKVQVDGTIDVQGDNGFTTDDQPGLIVSGGGAGGGILLEAPQIDLGPDGRLLARGGSGGAAYTTPTQACALAGTGATPSAPAVRGGDINYVGVPSNVITAGGGGGGLGRIRINTPEGTYTKSNLSIEDGSLSTGVLSTR